MAGGGPAGPPSPALPQAMGYAPGMVAGLPAAYMGLPPGYPGCPPPQVAVGPDGVAMGPAPVPFAPAATGPCTGSWPPGEYLCDGGDGGLKVQVGAQGQVVGLDAEDTVACFRTPDGRTVVEASNQVCVYSPRFRAVRQVVGLQSNEQMDRTADVFLPTVTGREEEVQKLRTSKQNIQASRDVGTRSLTVYRSRQGNGVLSTGLGPRGFQNAFLPYEDFAIIRLGAFQEAEMARLAKGVNAAIVWTHQQGVQVILDETRAAEQVRDQKVGTVYGTGELPGDPRLRLVKVASTHFAEPGDTVDFTLRFDNVGNQPIHSVTLLDNLSARLEYVPGSAQCSVPAQFGAQGNEAGSSALRCEITNPLRPGEGGILRFRCLVR